VKKWQKSEILQKKNCLENECVYYYLHFHKAGGTAMCHLASTNNIIANTKTNCLKREDEKNLEWWGWSKENQAQFLTQNIGEFISNEGGSFTNPPDPGQIAFIVTIRSPLDRVLSHFRHERKDNKFRDYSFAEFVSQGYPLANWASNFYIQHLTGCHYEECSYKHLQEAIRKVEYFSVVLVVDDSDSYHIGAQLLNSKFGWQNIDIDSQQRFGTYVQSRAVDELKDDNEALRQLIKMNELDLILFEYWKARFYQDFLHDVIRSNATISPQILSRIIGEKETKKIEDDETVGGRLSQKIINRSAFGGHNEFCSGHGIQPLVICQYILLENPRCDVLSYKDGACYLHSHLEDDFYIDVSKGHFFQSLSSIQLE